MISLTISAESPYEFELQLETLVKKLFPDQMVSDREVSSDEIGNDQTLMHESPQPVALVSTLGFVPHGVGDPLPEFSPIDDGTEYTDEVLEDWVLACSDNARKALHMLALGGVIDPRKTAARLGWSGTQWAGTWNGPRKQADRVKESWHLSSWPYGHTYEEPRRMWIHPTIADRLLLIIKKLATD